MKKHLSRILLALAAGFFLMSVDALAQTSARCIGSACLIWCPRPETHRTREPSMTRLRQRGYVEGPETLTVERRNATAGQPGSAARARWGSGRASASDLMVASGPQPNAPPKMMLRRRSQS